MEKLALRIGKLGSILGILAGLIELSIGTKILPWIGNKESPFILGLVTMILSSVALFSVLSASKNALLTNDRKVLIFLGVLLPAAICFTTVGILWYLPGFLLLITSIYLAYTYWIHRSHKNLTYHVSRKMQIDQMIGTIGSLLILAFVGLAFFMDIFGLFQSVFLVDADNIRFQIVPMDIVRMVSLTTNMVKDIEVSLVMYVYIMLILGASIALISSLVKSRMFKLMGGLIVMAGLIFFLAQIPQILESLGVPSVKLLDLIESIGRGWYMSMAGAVLIIVSSLYPSRLKGNR